MISAVGALAWRWVYRAVAVAFGTAALAGLVALALVAGRPHVSWSMRPASNQLVLQLTEGRGPLAGWLLSQGTLATPSLHGQRIAVALDPGRTTRVDVVVASVWTTTQRVSVTVPPLPALTGTAVGGDALTLNFSTPVMPRNAPCGLRPGGLLQPTLAFPRTHSGCSDVLEVASVSGEWTRVPVTVPALPTPTPAPPPPPPPATPRLIYSGPPAGNVFYITIDDGWYPNNDVLALMQQQHIPITTFLLSDAAATHVDFWKAFVAAGGEIEDHTINHPYMTRVNAATQVMQWSVAAQRLHALLGVTPQIARPPYGDWNASVVASAGSAGLHCVVMWNATMNSGHLATAGGPLRPGSIVLFHWTADVYQNLQTILALGAQAGLHPALLGPALQQTGY